MIVGGRFGGAAAARALARAPVDVTLVDRVNHHPFQPLLYQVATGIPGEPGYDGLIAAAGSGDSWFGHREWAPTPTG